MIIGFDGSRAFQAGRTGTETYSYQLLRNLAKIDQVNQYIVYLRPSIRSSVLQDWPKNFQFKTINWPRLWTQGGLSIRTFQDNLDILFVPAHTLPLIRKPGLETVVTVHDLGSEYLPSMHQLKQRFYLGLMQKFQLKTANKLIAVSRATKDDLVKRVGVSPEKISVIYEGYDKKLFKPVNGDILVNSLKQYGLESGKYFLFVGTVQPRKNLERLIKAFTEYSSRSKATRSYQRNYNSFQGKFSLRSNNNLQLIIVGQKGWLSDDIYKLPRQLGIADQVKFLGYAPEKDLPVLYSGAIALAFLSLFEGFGLPIVEAQACGCPVLTSNISSMPEVAGKGAVYVNPYDVDDIVKGMIKVQSAKFKVQSVKAGLENVSRFSWEKCAAQTLEVILSS